MKNLAAFFVRGLTESTETDTMHNSHDKYPQGTDM